jgi:MFS family permease
LAFVPLYLPLYLVERGLPKADVGAFSSASQAVVFVGMLFSGWLVRRCASLKAIVFVTDAFTYLVSSLFWIFASRPWFFLAGMLCYGIYGFGTASFNLLFSQGVSKNDLPKLFTFQTMSVTAAGLLSPLAGLFLKHYPLVTVTRWALGLSMALIAAGNLYRLMQLRQDASIKEAEKDQPFVLFELAAISREEKPSLLALLGMWLVVCFCLSLTLSYASIYFTDAQGLGLSASSISLLGGLSSAITIIFTLWAAPHFKDALVTRLLRLTFLILSAYALLVAVAPAGNLTWLLLATGLGSVGSLMALSLVNATVLSLSSAVNRVHLASACGILSSLAMVPGGLVAGWLYGHWTRGPFALSALLYGLVWLASLRFEFHSQESHEDQL